MARNGRPPRPTATSSQDYTNLLYSDTDSDEIPDLRLPPIKGKKQKRKRVSSGRPDEDNSSNLKVIFKIFLMILLIATVLCLAVVTFWTLIQMKELQSKFESLKNENKTPPEIIKFQSSLASMNGSIHDLKAGTIDVILRDISSIKSELDKLKDVTKTLQKSVEGYAEIVDIPNKLTTLQNLVADATSDLVEVKGKVEKLMEPKPTVPTTTEDPDKQAKISLEIDTLNRTLEGKLSNLSKTLDEHIMHMRDNEKPSSLEKNSTIDLVKRVIGEMNNNTIGSSVNVNEESRSAELDAMRLKLENITEHLKMVNTSSNQFYYGEYAVFKDQVTSEFENLSTSLLSVNDDLSHMSGRINTLGHNLIQLTGGTDVTSKPSSSLNNRVDLSTTTPNSKADIPAVESESPQPSSSTPSVVNSEQTTSEF